ncbi:M14 family metallopeptidase [bacterium]|nr:M14 family metallopeptidase [bacterium]
MIKLMLALVLMSITACGNPDKSEKAWLTYYEKSNFLETPRYDETIRYIQQLEKASPWVRLSYYGVTPEGRNLPLVIVDKNSHFTPEKVHNTNKTILLIQAGIHAGEIDGKDAGLMLIRDIAILGKHTDLLDHVTILFMPIFNVDGHERFSAYNRINQNGPKEMGWRVTSQNFNLNRDYMKADAPEMHAFLKMFHEWNPDFFVDCHVTDGADYRHVITYYLEKQINMSPPVREWSGKTYLPYLEEKMKNAGFPLSPYVGLVDENNIMKGLDGGVARPRFSTGYVALHNRPALLIETHMFKSYKQRVDGTYQMLLHTMELMNKEHASLKEAIKNSDMETASLTGRTVGLRFKVDYRHHSVIDFMGFNYRVDKSDISNQDWVIWENVPIDYKLPYYDSVITEYSSEAPVYYIIPRQWTQIIDILNAHGVEMTTLKKKENLWIESYQFQNVTWAQKPFEGRITVECDIQPIREFREFNPGDVKVRMNQKRNRVIMNLLEPKAPDSFVHWGFFNSIFEQKEYGEAYKLEQLADSMMKVNPALKAEFEEKIKTDTVFANSGYGRLNWFYMKSLYWDQNVNKYPIAKVMQVQPAIK